MAFAFSYLLPYNKITLSTSLPKLEVLARLMDVTDTYTTPMHRAVRPYKGDIGKSGFYMTPSITRHSSMNPELRGDINEKGTGTIITIAFEWGPINWIFTYGVPLLILLPVSFQAMSSELNKPSFDYWVLFLPAMAILVPVLCVYTFWYKSAAIQKHLQQLLEAEIVL